MVFEYMDHDLTGLSDRPGMRFTVPQIKVKPSIYIYDGSRLLEGVVLDLMIATCLVCYVPVLHEATPYGPSLLPCQSSSAS